MEEEEIIQSELERRREHEALRFFCPNSAQERFINAVNDPESRIVLFPAGNWVGKTAGAIAYYGAVIWPDLAEHPIFNHATIKEWKYPKLARILSTPTELEMSGSVQTEIKKWWPTGRYFPDKKGKQYPCEFRTDTDWLIKAMSYEQALTEFEGGTVSLFMFNEPPPESIYKACLARMKFDGKVLMPMTPLYGSGWIYDEIVAKNGEGGVRVIYGDTEDNCKEHSKNGVIPHQAIINFENSCDPDEKAARLHGRFMHLAGQIFKGFNRDVHVLEFTLPEDCSHFQVVDPAIGKPLAVLWAAVDRNGKLYICDEWPEFDFEGSKDSGLTVKDYAELFRSREEGRGIHIRILDRHFGNARRTCGGLTLKQEFADCGLDYQDSYHVAENEPEVETGILKIKDYLRYNKEKPIDSLNQPKLVISPKCRNLIASLERWGRNEKTGKPKEEYKDFADCLRYLVMSNPEVDIPREWGVKTAHYGVNN